MYRSLDPDAIVTTLETLGRRIDERFPDSGLHRVATELLLTARNAKRRVEEIRRPHIPLRIGVGVLILLIVSILVLAGVATGQKIAAGEARDLKIHDWIALAEPVTNEVILFGALILFLVTAERRWRRNQALRSIHELRALAHVVDMHQLTKDPQHAIGAKSPHDTPSSPTRSLTPFELSRYLDYCSEMFSLIGKVGALHVQHLDDPAVIASVNDVDQLTTGLSRKVWQKIVILHSLETGAHPFVSGEASDITADPPEAPPSAG